MKTNHTFWAAMIELASLLSGCATMMAPAQDTSGEVSIPPEKLAVEPA